MIYEKIRIRGELEKQQNSDIKREAVETPRTDEAAFTAGLVDIYIEAVDAGFARQLERENENLRKLLDKASRAISSFVNLRGMSATGLKSAHNGICILLSKTKMLDAIKAEVGEGD
jgi:hypothetical protein